MYPITQSLLIGIYPPAKRGMALALLAMVTVVAPIAGPILGGWITDNYSWPWIFFINVPIGIFASMVVANQFRGKVRKTATRRSATGGWTPWTSASVSCKHCWHKGN